MKFSRKNWLSQFVTWLISSWHWTQVVLQCSDCNLWLRSIYKGAGVTASVKYPNIRRECLRKTTNSSHKIQPPGHKSGPAVAKRQIAAFGLTRSRQAAVQPILTEPACNTGMWDENRRSQVATQCFCTSGTLNVVNDLPSVSLSVSIYVIHIYKYMRLYV